MVLIIYTVFLFFCCKESANRRQKQACCDYAEMQPFFVLDKRYKRKPMLVKQIISIFA